MSKIITTVSISPECLSISPEWAPPNVALAQVLVAGGLLNQKTNLKVNSKLKYCTPQMSNCKL